MNYGKKGTLKKKKSVNSKVVQIEKKLGVILLKAIIVCVIAAGVAGVSAGFGMIKGVIDDAPDITSESVIPRGYKSMVVDKQGNKTADLIAAGSNRIWVDIEKVPEHVKKAFVAVEDARFYEHNGIDLTGIIRAGAKGVASGFKKTEGASTITQQLLKNSVFDFMSEDGMAEKVERKLQEQYLAINLEKSMTKDEILQAYLNTINLGQNTLGIQSASNRYFGKDVSELTLSEAAVIAGITKNPSGYNPISFPEENAKRRKIVLNDMLEQEYITQSEYDKAMADDVYARIKTVNETKTAETVYSYYVDATIEQVLKDLQTYKGYSYQQAYNALYYGGLTIKSNQDPEIQRIMDEELQNDENYPNRVKVSLEYQMTVISPDGEQKNYSKENMISYFKEQEGSSFDLIFDNKEDAEVYIEQFRQAKSTSADKVLENIDFTIQPQASMVVMDQSNGAVAGIVGGRGVKEKSLTLNRATDSPRQPGSTYKIVSTYAPAIDAAGMSLATTQFDAAYNYRSGSPVHNWNGEAYHGWTTLRKAIEQSMNIVAVKTITDITPELAYSYLLNFGFTTLVGTPDANGNADLNQSTALGGLTWGVTNLELTAAYASIANGGMYTEPCFYSQIVDHDGTILLDKMPETHRVIQETTAWLLTQAMIDVVTKGTGTPAKVSGMTMAGKTGTTSKNNDIWFVGYTPYYTAGIWSGYDNNHKFGKGETSFHKTMWKKVMTRIHEGLTDMSFTKPDGIVSATVCAQSGKKPIPGVCPTASDYFAEGTVPQDYCDVHVVGTVCLETGGLATDVCPEIGLGILTMTPVDNQAPTSTTMIRTLQAPSCPIHLGAVVGGIATGEDAAAAAAQPPEPTE